MKTIEYTVSVGSGSTTGTVLVDENASEEEIACSILNSLYDYSYKEVVDTRLISLTDGTDMGGQVIVFKTNAPIDELKTLEKISNDVYINGGDPEDVPIWANALCGKGYLFDYVDECENVTAYTTSSEWLEDYYPEITEHYQIDNQPEVKTE